MTTQKTERRKRYRSGLLLFRQAFPTVGVLFCMLFFLRDPSLARDAVLRGLRISALNVIPSVFPFLVLSDLLLSGGGLPNDRGKGLRSLFRLSAVGGTAILLGWVCGFPVGARCAATELKNGRLTREEAERVIAAASVPSPAFLIGGVGVGLFDDRATGLFLWGSALAAAGIVGVFSTFRKTTTFPKSYTPSHGSTRPTSFPVRLTDALRGAALAALNLCAYIVFFSAVSAAANAVLSRFGASDPLRAVVSCLLELSGGVSDAAALPDRRLSLLFCAAAIGWSGLSVHFQTLAVCDGQSLRFGRFAFRKGLQAVICLGFAALWLRFHG